MSQCSTIKYSGKTEISSGSRFTPSNPVKLLVVDDDAVTRFTIEALLSTENYDITFAEHGEAGIEMASKIGPDIIMLDVMMPGINGYETCRRMRLLANLANIPIVLVSASDERGFRSNGMQSGADDVITKPFDTAELRAHLRELLPFSYRRLFFTVRSEFEAMSD